MYLLESTLVLVHVTRTSLKMCRYMLLEQARIDVWDQSQCERMKDGTCYWNKSVDRRLLVLDSLNRGLFCNISSRLNA